MEFSKAQEIRNVYRSKLIRGCGFEADAEVDYDRMYQYLAQNGAPRRYLGRLGDLSAGRQPIVTAAAEAMRTTDIKHSGVYLTGDDAKGIGDIAGRALSACALRGCAVAWVSFPEHAHEVAQSISTDRNREWDVDELRNWRSHVDELAHVYDLLVLHDVQPSLLTNQHLANQLYRMVAARNDAGLYTMITSPGPGFFGNTLVEHVERIIMSDYDRVEVAAR